MVKKVEYKCRNAKVYFRCTPKLSTSWDFVKVLDDRKTIYVRCLQDFLVGSKNTLPNYWCFETDGVFYNDSQNEIYLTIMLDILRGYFLRYINRLSKALRFLDGVNAAIIAYGATGTGKSLTISGVENSFEDRGLVFRALENLIKLRENCKHKMKVIYRMSFIEATNTHVYDLLDENVPVYDSSSINQLSKVAITDLQSCLVEIFKGEGRKTIVKNAAYNSHACHSVLTIMASCRLNDEVKPVEMMSKLHFVDLAGVDTVGNKSCFYKNVMDIGMANVTKTQIEQFILTVIENITENILVKQKLNILIQYLGDTLNHTSHIRLIGHIRTGRNDLMMTLSMLRLNNVIRGLKGKKGSVQARETKLSKIKHLQETVNAMRQELEIQSMILNSSLSKNLTQDRLSQLQRLAENFLSDKINELAVVSFSDVNTILKVFKDKFLDLEKKKQEEVDAAYQSAFEKAMQIFKTSSRSSLLKKLPVSKSKESIQASQSSKTSKRSLSWKGSKGSTDSKEKAKKGSKDTPKKSLSAKKSTTSSISTIDQKSSKYGSKTIRKSLKKKSSIMSDVKDESSTIADEPLPEDVPDYEQAWNEFVVDETYDYAKWKRQLDGNEDIAKETNIKYLNEVRNLQDMRKNFESKKEALKLAQMGREIAGVVTMDEEAVMKLSAAEKEFKNALTQMEGNLLKQQENVLLLQSELRLQLEVCKQNRLLINEQYAQFCSEKYKTILPNLQKKSTEILSVDLAQQSTKAEKEAADEATTDISECYNEIVKYNDLKDVMEKQRIKKKIRDRKKEKWIRSCKPY